MMLDQMAARFIDSYVHGGRIGVLIELETADDFATRTKEFRTLACDLAMQITASERISARGGRLDNVISTLDMITLSSDTEQNLTSQIFIKKPDITIAERIRQVEARLGVPIRVVRFVRFRAGTT
jgi:elongation factor Ts